MKLTGMLKAKTIRPTTCKGKEICCEGCEISYSKRDYNILFKAKKISYFDFLDNTVCHDCFYKTCRRIAVKEGLPKIKVELTDWRKKMTLNIPVEKD